MKRNSIAIVKHLVYISLEIVFLWQIFPISDGDGVGIATVVSVVEYCINLACDVICLLILFQAGLLRGSLVSF